MKKHAVILALVFVLSPAVLARGFDLVELPTEAGSMVGGLQPVDRSMLVYSEGSASADQGTGGGLASSRSQTAKLGAFAIDINAGATLAANPDALAAFNRAAAQWEARIADPITVNIDADLADLGGGNILGQASTLTLFAGYDTIRDAMVLDSSDESDDGIVAFLPTAAEATFVVPALAVPSIAGLSGAKANMKALGFTGLDAQFGATDATIEFNTQFSFDFDNSDGVDAGTWDFETIAAHEIGHALGFLSEVDYIDYLMDNGYSHDIVPSTLDLFRFENDEAGADPETPGEFTTNSRYLLPEGDPITDTLDTVWGTLSFVSDSGEFRMSTGTTQGDGRQASHWKDNVKTGSFIGAMDPTLSSATIQLIEETDLRALDVIGYEIAAVPEPATLVMLLSLVIMVLFWYRQRKRPA